MTLVVLGVQLVSLWRQSTDHDAALVVTSDEESPLDWDGVTGHNTWSLLTPARSYKLNIVIFSLLAGILSFLSCVTLRYVTTHITVIIVSIRYQVIKIFFPDSTVSIVLLVLTWLTVFISLQSLVTYPGINTPDWSTESHAVF